MPRRPQVPKYQRHRTYLRVSITMHPETRAVYDRIIAARPELLTLSAAIDYAGRELGKRIKTPTP